MVRSDLIVAAATAITSIGALTCIRLTQAQSGPEREILLQEDLAIPGFEVVLTETTLAVGEREGRHTHPGTLVGHMLEGELTLEREGLPTVVLTPGDSIMVTAERIHEGINTGDVPVKTLAFFIVEKGEPLSTQSP